MAGRVHAQRSWTLIYTELHLKPDICPVEALNRTMPSCVAMEGGAGHANVCPFLHAVELHRGGSVHDLDRGADYQWWLNIHHFDGDSYDVLCLRKEAHGTPAGARLRP